MAKADKTLGGYRLITFEERQLIRKLISDIQRPKHWKEKRLSLGQVK